MMRSYVARKRSHRCDDCGDHIELGDRYYADRDHKICVDCKRAERETIDWDELGVDVPTGGKYDGDY